MSSTQPLRVLMLSSEAAPVAKAGGLADMVSSLSTHLADLGHDVRLIVPHYRGVEVEITRRFPLRVQVGFRDEELRCVEAVLPQSQVKLYLLDHPLFSDRDGIYGNEEVEFFPDNGKRFALLSRSAFALSAALNWRPHILHSHDWPTGLAPLYLRSLERRSEARSEARNRDEKENRPVSIFTIHNIGYQGCFSLHDLHYTRLSPRQLYPGVESAEELNYLKIGIANADFITTVSPQYAREIQTPAYGHGLEELLASRREDLFGVLNGIDTEVWNPAEDPFLEHPFSREDLRGKAALKQILQEENGLETDPSLGVIGIVSRLVEQKGFRELLDGETCALEQIVTELPCQLVLLGTGEKWAQERLQEMAARLPRLAVTIGFNERMAHLIEGGSDFFLMPSRYEPCGLNQIYSLRYGTLPIARRTGGLADTIIDYWSEGESANGFLFDEMGGEAIFKAVRGALDIYHHRPDEIQRLQTNGMSADFSWDTSAQHYLDLYRFAIKRCAEARET